MPGKPLPWTLFIRFQGTGEPGDELIGIPYQAALAFPCVLTLIVYVGLVGRTRTPRALGLLCVKG